MVGDVEGVRRGCVAAFPVRAMPRELTEGSPAEGAGREGSEGDDDAAGADLMVVMAETRLPAGDEAGRDALRHQVRTAVADRIGVAPDRVVLVAPRTVPKTSSGKIRRAEARRMVESGAIAAPHRALWWQVVRLAVAGAPARLRSRLAGTASVAYGAWFWTVFALAAAPVWLLVWGLPVLALRRRVVRAVVRWLARATGTGVRVTGLEHLAGGPEGPAGAGGSIGSSGPWVFVANHASYLDGLILAAALPPDAGYVVKSELRRQAVIHLFLRRLGCVFVERFDPSRGEQESGKAARALARGDHLVIFPEGTLRPAAGLQPFRMGAFVVAARTGTPVVPVVIEGSRAKLRGGTWLPRPGGVAVTVCPPLSVAGSEGGSDWSAAVSLRDRARRAILERLAEPDLS